MFSSSPSDPFQYPKLATVEQLDAKSKELGLLSIQEYNVLLQKFDLGNLSQKDKERYPNLLVVTLLDLRITGKEPTGFEQLRFSKKKYGKATLVHNVAILCPYNVFYYVQRLDEAYRKNDLHKQYHKGKQGFATYLNEHLYPIKADKFLTETGLWTSSGRNEAMFATIKSFAVGIEI